MNLALFLSMTVADIVPPPPDGGPRALMGSSLASLCFWALAVVGALMLWRIRRRRAVLVERTDRPVPESK